MTGVFPVSAYESPNTNNVVGLKPNLPSLVGSLDGEIDPFTLL